MRRLRYCVAHALNRALVANGQNTTYSRIFRVNVCVFWARFEFYKIRKGRVGKAVINLKSKPWVWQLTNCSRGIPNAWRFNAKFGKSVYGVNI